MTEQQRYEVQLHDGIVEVYAHEMSVTATGIAFYTDGRVVGFFPMAYVCWAGRKNSEDGVDPRIVAVQQKKRAEAAESHVQYLRQQLETR